MLDLVPKNKSKDYLKERFTTPPNKIIITKN